MPSTRSWLVTLTVMLLFAACQSPGGDATPPAPDAQSPSTPSSENSPVVRMPDLVGMPAVEAGRRIGEIEATHRLGISSSWRTQPIVRCGTRPDTVTSQRPAPGTPLKRRTVVHVRTAALDLDRFRGPCQPAGGNLGPVAGRDGALARQFYRFAANPALGAPFVNDEVWLGIEDGWTAKSLGVDERSDLSSWQLHTGYAEATGPFSALDVLASSGGYFELHRGVSPTCPSGNGKAPPGLAGLRPISLTAPADTTMACSEWWAVTLFLDRENQIHGVALRLGSP